MLKLINRNIGGYINITVHFNIINVTRNKEKPFHNDKGVNLSRGKTILSFGAFNIEYTNQKLTKL